MDPCGSRADRLGATSPRRGEGCAPARGDSPGWLHGSEPPADDDRRYPADCRSRLSRAAAAIVRPVAGGTEPQLGVPRGRVGSSVHQRAHRRTHRIGRRWRRSRACRRNGGRRPADRIRSGAGRRHRPGVRARCARRPERRRADHHRRDVHQFGARAEGLSRRDQRRGELCAPDRGARRAARRQRGARRLARPAAPSRNALRLQPGTADARRAVRRRHRHALFGDVRVGRVAARAEPRHLPSVSGDVLQQRHPRDVPQGRGPSGRAARRLHRVHLHDRHHHRRRRSRRARGPRI